MKDINNRLHEILRLKSEALKRCVDLGEQIELLQKADKVAMAMRGVAKFNVIKAVYREAINKGK